LRRKLRQLGEGVARLRIICFATVAWLISMPSLSNSPWIRGALQIGLAAFIYRIRSRTWRSTDGRPDLETVFGSPGLRGRCSEDRGWGLSRSRLWDRRLSFGWIAVAGSLLSTIQRQSMQLFKIPVQLKFLVGTGEEVRGILHEIAESFDKSSSFAGRGPAGGS
jgi:hypothetical protein